MIQFWPLLPADGWERFAFDVAWQSTLIAAVAFVVVRCWRMRPATRAALALGALILCLSTPALTLCVRSQGWGILRFSPSLDPKAEQAFALLVQADLAMSEGKDLFANDSQDASSIVPHRFAAIRMSTIFGCVWGVASSVLAIRLALSLMAVRHACRHATLCRDSALQSMLIDAAAKLGVPPPALYTSDAIQSPMLISWGGARLVLPTSAMPREDWAAVFHHELAHLVRHDASSRLLVELIVVTLPWQPLVWLLRAEFRAACEEACDDWAVAAGTDPLELASLLVDFVPQAGLALALGMSESASAARQRVLRLLSMQGTPRAHLGWRAAVSGGAFTAVLATFLALLQYGSGAQEVELIAEDQREASISQAESQYSQRVELPTYVIEPPDVLRLEVARFIPKGDYRIDLADILQVAAKMGGDNHAFDRPCTVQLDGMISFGPEYGEVFVAGLTLSEAREAVKKHLAATFENPQVSLMLSEIAGQKLLNGDHLVAPDGTIMLGQYGSVPVAGKTLSEARAAIEERLHSHLVRPIVSLDVFAYNSKYYYVVTSGGTLGDTIHRLPITGNETVIDAVTQIGGISKISHKQLWVARPAKADGSAQACVLPVDWRAIVELAETRTNWQILPGDRVFICETLESPPTIAPSRKGY